MAVKVKPGSSPQARGTELIYLRHRLVHRFIPAGAGNGFSFCGSHRIVTVHPRRRGERNFALTTGMNVPGSSPQARGTADPEQRHHPVCRFIPAGAGNGQHNRNNNREKPVHPRRRGERQGKTLTPNKNRGSSPQARGTVFIRHHFSGRKRFIPAGAGNGESGHCRRSGVPVHPRRRGERSTCQWARVYSSGSSPQARGTGMTGCERMAERRFIPAGAGNGLAAHPGRTGTAVHPRRRGEREWSVGNS